MKTYHHKNINKILKTVLNKEPLLNNTNLIREIGQTT